MDAMKYASGEVPEVGDVIYFDDEASAAPQLLRQWLTVKALDFERDYLSIKEDHVNNHRPGWPISEFRLLRRGAFDITTLDTRGVFDNAGEGDRIPDVGKMIDDGLNGLQVHDIVECPQASRARIGEITHDHEWLVKVFYGGDERFSGWCRPRQCILLERPKPTPSLVTQTLCNLLIERDARGREKYGATLDRTDLTAAEWNQNRLEELLDAIGYCMAERGAIEKLTAELDELRRERDAAREENAILKGESELASTRADLIVEEIERRVVQFNAKKEEAVANCDYERAVAFRDAAKLMEMAAKKVGIKTLERSKQHDEAYEYLARLFRHYAPQCEPMESLTGLCTQIDNCMVGMRDDAVALQSQLDSANATVAALQKRLSQVDDATVNWKSVNARRNELIHRKLNRTADAADLEELQLLQDVASLRSNLLAPLPLDELEAALAQSAGNDKAAK